MGQILRNLYQFVQVFINYKHTLRLIEFKIQRRNILV